MRSSWIIFIFLVVSFAFFAAAQEIQENPAQNTQVQNEQKAPRFVGYIVELSMPSSLERLENEQAKPAQAQNDKPLAPTGAVVAGENQGIIESIYNAIISPILSFFAWLFNLFLGFFGFGINTEIPPLNSTPATTTPTALPAAGLSAVEKKEIVLAQRQEIQSEHALFLEKVENEIGRKPEVINEFSDVFNGVALGLTASEAEKVKSMTGVKGVYKNFVAHTT